MTREEQIAAIERDRKRREAGLTLFLLALAEKSRRYVNRAIRVGSAWASVLRGVLLGDESLDLRGGVPVLSRAMAETHHAGVARVGRLIDVATAPQMPLDALAESYAPRAGQVLERVRGSLDGAVAEALAGAVGEDRISADVRAVAEAYKSAGWAPENPYAAAAEATGVVTASYASGMAEAMQSEPVAAVMTGLRFVNPMDEATTGVCRARHGVTLPLDHPWLVSKSWPPLHFGCPCRHCAAADGRGREVHGVSAGVSAARAGVGAVGGDAVG
jgi:hypothetical protein